MASPFRRAARCLAAEAAPFGLDAFCFPQFDDPLHAGTRLHGLIDKSEFLRQVHAYVESKKDVAELVEGYAPFCCHLFLPNFCGVLPSALEITSSNQTLLRSGYIARRAEELPVLTRWFPAAAVTHLLQPAKYLDLILYSREQIEKEAAAMQQHQQQQQQQTDESAATSTEKSAAPRWSIIAIKAQDEPYELPMAPITMMRNALIEEGGSGVPIDRAAYAASVNYWSSHAIIRQQEGE